MENRTTMEETLAHLVRTVEELSDVVARQDRDIAKLERRVVQLMEREAAREAEGSGGAVFAEKPPHY